MRRAWSDPPILAMMVGQTVIWASIFYSFPALVLHWQAEFGWSSAQVMGAFSLALFVQAIAAPRLGRLIDGGHAPLSFPGGAVLAAAALIGVTQATTLTGFYALWAVLGIAMGLTLYDACFALVTRARGAEARPAITAITLVAGFASTLAFPLLNVVAGIGGWRMALVLAAGLVLLVNLPLAWFAARRLEADALSHSPQRAAPSPRPQQARLIDRPGFLPLTAGISLSALGTAIIVSHMLPLLAALGVASAAAILAASMVGPSQVAGRVAMAVLAARQPAVRMMIWSILGSACAALLLFAAGLGAGVAYLFAILHGASFGLLSILRPVAIRDTLGTSGFGALQGAVLRPALLAFAAAPYLAAFVADLAGYKAVLFLCVAAQLAGAVLIARVRATPQ